MSRADDLLSFMDDEPEPIGPALSARAPWRVLVVDDDPDVHQSTIYALRGLQVAERSLELLHAHSAEQALAMLRVEPRIAVILLDVVMESANAGLDLVQRVRGELNLQNVRIILRTGQPGQAPELETIRRYDINDYKTKSELTRGKLYATLTAAVRSYDQLRRLDASRRGLEKVIAASNQFIAEQGLVTFAEGVIMQIAGLLGVDAEGLVCACLDPTPRAAPEDGDTCLVIAAAGRYRHLIRRRIDELDSPTIAESLQACLQQRQNQYGAAHVTLFFAGRHLGDFAAHVTTTTPLCEVDRHLLEVFCTNITLCAANVALVARLRELAYFDPLVRLPNRAATIEFLDQRIGQGLLDGQVLATIDIDRFAETNDIFGHPFGDQLLKALALRLAQHLAPHCHVARVAGNTFAVVGDAEHVNPDALQTLLEAPLEVAGASRRLSVSMAFVRCDEIQSADGSDLLKDAAIVMKHVRAGGPGRSGFYTREIRADSRERTRLLHGLQRALDLDRLFLMYQPKVELATGQLTGLEALMRWRADDGSLVQPDHFIPVAEQSGLIVALGEWALRSALVHLRQLSALGHEQLRVAVNVSAVQFGHPQFLQTIERALDDSGMHPERLELEITESVAVIGMDRVASTLQAVRAREVGIAIDDFGTGFSSLSYLDRLPADRLKIDRAFVQLLETERPGARIARMIVPLGHQLGMKVLAEGVETPEQAQALSEMGCDEAQGFLVARPMDYARLQGWLEGYRPRPVAQTEPA